MRRDRSTIPFGEEPITPVPRAVGLDAGKVRLGETLFHDARLSRGDALACASCHRLDEGGDDNRARAPGADGELLDFNAPTVFNAALSFRLNWRGNFRTLEEQNEAVLLDPRLMNTTWEELLPKLRADADYREAFAAVYGGGPAPAHVLDALATFQRSLLTPDARFDRYLRGRARGASRRKKSAATELFKAYGCVACHQGVNVGGNLFQKFGVFYDPFAERRCRAPKPTSGASPSPARKPTATSSAFRACATSPSRRPISTMAGPPRLEEAVDDHGEEPAGQTAHGAGNRPDRGVPAHAHGRVPAGDRWPPIRIARHDGPIWQAGAGHGRPAAGPDLSSGARRNPGRRRCTSACFEALHALTLNDAALHRDVLRARAGLLRNYDPLVQASHGLRESLETLRAAGGDLRGDIGGGIEPASSGQPSPRSAEQEALVETFKSTTPCCRTR